MSFRTLAQEIRRGVPVQPGEEFSLKQDDTVDPMDLGDRAEALKGRPQPAAHPRPEAVQHGSGRGAVEHGFAHLKDWRVLRLTPRQQPDWPLWEIGLDVLADLAGGRQLVLMSSPPTPYTCPVMAFTR